MNAPVRDPLAGRPANSAQGELRAEFIRAGARTCAGRTYEAGGLRLRFPRLAPGAVPGCEAVCINTGGGMVGGDRARLAFQCQADAAVTVTTQSAEKIYRAEGAPTAIDVSLDLQRGATLEWLPQETILFDRVRLKRSLSADLTSDATLLLVESLVFGRLAMGETVSTGLLQDRWRIRRDGRLVFAEELRLEGDIVKQLDRPALGGGARVFATLLLVAPEAEARLEEMRDVLGHAPAEAGASAWNGLLSVRMASPSPERVRATIVLLLNRLRGRAAPRVWQ